MRAEATGGRECPDVFGRGQQGRYSSSVNHERLEATNAPMHGVPFA